MKNRILIACALTVAVGFTVPGAAFATDEAGSADNTKANKGIETTAEQQGEKAADRKITQQIRRAVVKDKSLSTYAHNVKIITKNGMVTLKGPVKSEKEKQAIEQAAAQVVGKGKVTNELTVKQKSEDKSGY